MSPEEEEKLVEEYKRILETRFSMSEGLIKLVSSHDEMVHLIRSELKAILKQRLDERKTTSRDV